MSVREERKIGKCNGGKKIDEMWSGSIHEKLSILRFLSIKINKI
jgi:hypothetical protein